MPATITHPVVLDPTWQCPDYPPPWLTPPPTDHGYDPNGDDGTADPEPDRDGAVFDRIAAVLALILGCALLVLADASGLLAAI